MCSLPTRLYTLLGMKFTRASQVATGVLFHSSMMTSRSWWKLETLHSSTFRLGMPHQCSMGFRSGDMLGQSITFTLSFLEVCLWVIFMLEYCPAAQSPKGGYHALLQTWYSWSPQLTVAHQCRQLSCCPRP